MMSFLCFALIAVISGALKYHPENNTLTVESFSSLSTWETVLVIDGRSVVRVCSHENLICEFNLSSIGSGYHVLVSYSRVNEEMSKLDQIEVTLDPVVISKFGSSNFSASSLTSALATSKVGILYEVWHSPAATAMTNVKNLGGVQLSVEDVIQSNGKYGLSDVLKKYNQEGVASNFYYQDTPQLGYYCLYRARSGEQGIVPDCPNIPATAKNHATTLLGAGVDYVVTDSTNLGTFDSGSDVIQQRPTEVLFEEFNNLRQAGQNTPSIAVWQTVPTGSNLYQYQLALYNNYSDLVFKDPKSGKKVFFYPVGSPDQAILNAIQSNGGRNDIITVPMWALFDTSLYAQGRWSFMSPCTTSSGGYTTSVVSSSCNQHYTTNSVLGTEVTVSPSYQLSYASVPYSAASKYGGQTFKKQWLRAFDVKPEHLFIASFNEFIAQPQANPWNTPYTFDWGLPADAMRASLFVDTYAQISRDIEPSVHQGTAMFDIMSSCLRVYRLALAGYLNSTSGACGVPSEICCQTDAVKEGYVNVWSFEGVNGNVDRLLTTDANEAAYLPTTGGWKQMCNAFGGPTDFCVNTGLVNSYDAVRGPFLLFTANATGRIALYRCTVSDSGHHFFTPSSNCEGQKIEALLGYLSPSRSSLTPRSLTRCRIPSAGSYYAALDYGCNSGDVDEGHYGYVF